MAGTPTKTGSRLATILVIIPILALVYFMSPLFLPRWRWEHMDPKWEQLAQQTKLPVARLKQTYRVVVRYRPRADNDPVPWQIITSDPLFDPENDEEKHLVRATLVSDRTGEPPSSLRIGSGNYRDIVFSGSAWRFPPGTFGFNRRRPVVVYEASTFEKVDTSKAYQWENELKEGTWSDDDDDVEDGFQKAGTQE